MLYAYDIKETSEGFVGECFDLDFVTKPQKTFDDAEETLTDGFAGFIELVYRKKGKPIPLPATDCKNKMALYVPIKLQLRILLWNTMLEQHIKQVELADKLGVSKAQINQMLCGKGGTSESKYEEALRILGKTPNVVI